jgi:hypothetical protein
MLGVCNQALNSLTVSIKLTILQHSILVQTYYSFIGGIDHGQPGRVTKCLGVVRSDEKGL